MRPIPARQLLGHARQGLALAYAANQRAQPLGSAAGTLLDQIEDLSDVLGRRRMSIGAWNIVARRHASLASCQHPEIDPGHFRKRRGPERSPTLYRNETLNQ